LFSTTDTIVAIATPAGRGGLGVVRVSGPDACAVAARIVDRRAPLAPRRATLARVKARGGAAVDRVVVTWFPRPGSYTGEDVVEVSAHGSPVLLADTVQAAIAAGARLAEPGEFTLRAFLNGRIDLVQAEAVADLIDAVTPGQARAAFDQLEGTLTNAIAAIDRAVFDLTAQLEASLDFPDEGYHFVEPGEAAREAARLVEQINALLDGAAAGRLIREGCQAVILGRPNAGKSSLFNYLVGSERAIVTPVPGTTRDLVTEVADVGGIPVTFVDTAGLRRAGDAIEAEGVWRARRAQTVADLQVLVLDRSRPLDDEDAAMLAGAGRAPHVVVVNKCDLSAAWGASDLPSNGSRVVVSLKTGEGLDALRPALAGALTGERPGRDTPAVTNVRHTSLLERARTALARAADAARNRASEEFVLADLHEARGALEEITGRRTTEDMLAHIFERFCIGK
jgi:tRNA modification GTPase